MQVWDPPKLHQAHIRIHHPALLLKNITNECISKGQLISKVNCQAVDSPKKQTNEFAFFDMKSCYLVKSNAICSFFGSIYGMPFCLQFSLTVSSSSFRTQPGHINNKLEACLE